MKITFHELAACLSGSLTQSRLLSPAFTGGCLTEGGLLDTSGFYAQLDPLYKKACIDSREVGEGSIFFCLKGARFDGHDFAHDAAKAGASAIIAQRDPFAKEREAGSRGVPAVFVVDDTLKALWLLAFRQRSITKARVIGITGSAGKTTLKETLAHVLSGFGKTEKNHKNFNTQIGLPLSMINADEDAAYWVMEVGISQPHDMDELGAILQPDIAVVLNVTSAHTQGLGEKGVAWHKSRLFNYLTPNGSAVYCKDYPDLFSAVETMDFKKQSIVKKIFSITDTHAFSYARFAGLGTTSEQGVFMLSIQGEVHDVFAPFVGEYGAENIAAIAAVIEVLGLSITDAFKRLPSAVLPEQRFNRFCIGNTTVIDDSYNANPLSAGRMIKAAASISALEKKGLFLVMGEMRELGDESLFLHRELGQIMAQVSPAEIIWTGDYTQSVQQGLNDKGYSGVFTYVSDTNAFLKTIRAADIDNKVILFKGSRGNCLERWVIALQENFGDVACAL